MNTSATHLKGHKNSNSIKRHGIRVKNSMSTCPKSLWIIGCVLIVVLIAISTAAVTLGQDLIHAGKQKTVHQSHSDSQSHDNDLKVIANRNRLKKKTSSSHSESNESNKSNDENEDNDDYEDPENEVNDIENTENDMERMDVNGNTVNIKKSEINKVWNEVEKELDGNDNTIEAVPETKHDSEPPPLSELERVENNKIVPKSSKDHSNSINIDIVREKHDDLHDHDVSHSMSRRNPLEKGFDDDTDPKKRVHAMQHNSQKGNEKQKSFENENENKNEVNIQFKHVIDPLDKNKNKKTGDVLYKNKDNEWKKRNSEDSDYESVDLQRALFREYYELPTFFDIDKNDDDYLEKLVSFFKKAGKAHYNKYSTKYREIQNYDLMDTVLVQDEEHNQKLNYIFDINNKREHSWNIDYDYLYPFMYNVNDYNPELLKENTFQNNLSYFLNSEIHSPKSRYIPRYDLYEIYSSHNIKYQRLISKKDSYRESEEYLRQHYKDVELIFPENDTLLFAQMYQFGLKLKEHILKEETNSKNSGGGHFLRSLKYLEDQKSSSRRRRFMEEESYIQEEEEEERRRRLEGFDILNRDSVQKRVNINDIDLNKLGSSTREDIDHPRIHNFNGLTSDISYYHRNKSSIRYYHNLELDDPMKSYINGNMALYNEMDHDISNGKLTMYENNKFWRLQDHCIRRKSSTVYPNWRILYKSSPLTCDIILDKLIDPVSNCLFELGWKCPLLIDYGYFRFVFKSEAKAKYLYSSPDDPEKMIPIVLKVMKTQFVDWSSDWMRHIREAIFLQQLRGWEQEFMDEFGPQFNSNGEDRAFYYVPELGHCLYPTYIVVTPFYDNTLRDWVRNGNSREMSLKDTTRKSLEIFSGLQILHNIRGGPYAHTDLQPRQFMVDDNNNILINDFNRGKFTEYYFKKELEPNTAESDLVIPCTYCMPWSHGHYRAPEEYKSDPMNEALDLWSICLTVWNLFSYEKPWSSMGGNYEAVKYLVRDYQMKPKFAYSIPPYLKDLFRQCWRQDPLKRPDINELIRGFRYFYKHIHRLSDGKEKWTLDQLRSTKAFKETNYPDMEQIMEFVK